MPIAHDRTPTLRQKTYEVLERGRRGGLSALFDVTIVTLIVSNVFLSVIGTVDWVREDWGGAITLFDRFCVAIFILEYAARLWVAPEHPLMQGRRPVAARFRTALMPLMIVDLVAILPFFLEMFTGMDLAVLRVLRIARFYRLARYAPAIATIGRVLATEWRALVGTGVIFIGLLLLSSVAMFLAEGHLQPERLGDVPSAMWWAVVTLSTVGYGDVTPITPLGKLIAGMIMAMGLIFFALPVGIIANGFQEEIKRRDFVVSFAMVARVPLFAQLEIQMIARLVGLLRAQRFSEGALVMARGDPADAMYFIASGEVEVEVADAAIRLGEGDFFGEIALLHHEAKRTANIYAVRPTDLLVLTAADFRRIAHQNPELARAVRETAEQRLAQNRRHPGVD